MIGAVLSLVLLALAVAKSRAVIEVGTELWGSGVLVLLAAAWALSRAPRLERASEIYLTLAFIVSVNHLQVIANGIATWLDRTELDVFRVVGAVHLAIVIAALWILGAWPSPRQRVPLARVAAGLFVLGAVIFWIGARTFPGMTLEQVHAHAAAHLWTSVNFLIATLVTVAGLALFTLASREHGDRALTTLGLIAFTVGAVFWTLHLVFRLTVAVQAAEEWSVAAVTPEWYEPWRLLAAWLFAIYSVLSYIALAGYGAALITLGWVPRWAAWLCIVSGVIAAPLGGLPLFIHVPLWIVGILVLRKTPRAAAASA